MNSNEEVDLYVQAIKEQFSTKMASITAEYEDKIARLRVELTMTDRERQQLQNKLEQISEDNSGSVPEEPAAEAAGTSN